MKTALIFVTTLLSSLSLAQAMPVFQDYPAPSYSGKAAPLKLNSETNIYRTRFKELSQRQGIDFAGRYRLDFAGCGTNCVVGLLYNVQTGNTQILLNQAIAPCFRANDDDDVEHILYRRDSRLISINSIVELTDTDPVCQQSHYLEHQGRIQAIKP